MADEQRRRRVADRIQQTVARFLERGVKDPRLGFLTITDVRVTGDLQHATIFYTVYGSAKEAEQTARALESARGMIRSEVGRALGIRLTPSIEFQTDSLPQAAAQIDQALARARQQDEAVSALASNATYAGEADPYKVSPSAMDEQDGEG